MRSWDLFGTLVAGRDPSVRDGDQQHHVPIAENIARVRPQDLIVSDFYDKEKAEIILRYVAELRNSLHVSHDDKATGKIWDRLGSCGQMPSEHFGDDAITDYASPKSRGIAATMLCQAQQTSWEQKLSSLGLVALANIVREARLRTWNSEPEMRALQLFQIECNFPFLYVASLWFHRKLIEGGYTKFLMSSRDCFPWKKIMDRMKNMDDTDSGPLYEPIYWWTSRVTRYKPSANYLGYLYSVWGRLDLAGKVLITDICGFGKSLASMSFPSVGVDTCLLVGYPSDSNLVCYFPCAISGWMDESANLAKHPMVIDVVNGEPVFWDDGIDWTANPHINAMHDAFDACIAAMDNYPFPHLGDLDSLLKITFDNMGSRLRALDPLTPFRRDEAVRAAELLNGIEGVVV